MAVTAPDLAGGFQPPFAIVEAKLHPISKYPGSVDRSRLLDLLAMDPPPRVVAVMAPPGYGKTTLLAQWVAREHRPVAWVTLDERDNDPAVLVTYLAAALDRVRPIDPGVRAGLSGSGRRVLAVAVPRLVSTLHRWDAQALLVLDDVHRITDSLALDGITALLDHVPPGFTVALAGRRAPDLPLARLRAQRALLEIDTSLLALDERETGALARATGWTLEPHEVRELAARTEGWAAAVYLASLARTGNAISHGPPRVSGADRFVADYLRSEVKGRLAAEDVVLLTRTSVLETVTPELAESVAQLPEASRRLADLAAGNLLIQGLSGPAPTYRYHNLLREFLEHELADREPGLIPELHRRAAACSVRDGIPDRAVRHLLLAGDPDAAARLLAAVSLPMFYGGGVVTIERLLARFDRPAFERTPSLAVLAAWIYLMLGRADEAFAMADIVESSVYDGPSAMGAASFASERAMLRAMFAMHGPADVLASARLAVDQEPSSSPWRSNALWLLGSAHRLLGQPDAADQSYAEAVDAGASAGATAMVSLAARAALAIRGGDWASADRLIRQSDAILERARYDGLVVSLLTHALAARVEAHGGNAELARRHLVQAQLVRPLATHAGPWYSVDALLELTRAYLAVSDLGGAQQALRDAERIIRRRPALGTVTDDLVAMRRRLDAAATTLAGSSSLTAAELRVLPLLPTYLSFQEIADRLMLSRNTVKTHAMAIYGKLWASSRGEAVERAVELGLLEPYPVLQHAHPREDLPQGDGGA